MSIESVMSSNHLILCHPLLLLPSILLSLRVFSNESVLCIRWSSIWSFSFSISPSNEYSGLISFRMDRLDLLAVHGTLKSLLQHHSSKASIVRPDTPVPLEGNTEVPGTTSTEPFHSSWSRQDGRFPCFVWMQHDDLFLCIIK